MDQDALEALRPLLVAWSATLGAVVGSFLNVVIARVPAGLSVVSPRSRCPRCLAGIAWYDNLPVVSWLLLRARCRRCGQPISARYPLVELLVALLAGLAAWRHGPAPAALVELTFAALLVALAFIDLDTWLLPWALTLPLSALGLAAGALGWTPAGSLASAALGGALGFGAFLAVHLVGERVLHREALGFGDVVLLGALGAFLGPRGLLPLVMLASLQGAAVGIALLVAGRGEPGPEALGDAAAAVGAAGPEVRAPGAGPTADSESTAPVNANGTPNAPANRPTDAIPTLTAAAAPPDGAPLRPPGDEHPAAEAEVDDWVPPRHAIPFGPFLALAALEWLYLARPLARLVPALSLFLG